MRARTPGAVAVAAILTAASFAGWSGRASAGAAAAAVTCPSNPDGSAVRGDLTGQGRGHTVVGLPSRNQIEDIGPAGARWHLTETHTNVAASSDPAIGFGAAVLLANVNGDRCVDLVVGAPHTGATTATKDRGAVDILLMTPTLPDLTTVVRIDGPQAGALFGSSLAMTQHADVRDLWVGAPGYSTAAGKGIGAVLHYTIAPGAAPVLAQTILNQSPLPGDYFGAVLDEGTGLTSAAGAGHTDSFVMVGTPDRTVSGRAGAGEVEWIRTPDTTGVGSIMAVLNEATPSTITPERGDHFGFSIAAGDVGQATLIGDPGEDLRTTVDAGLVARTSVAADGTIAHMDTFDQSKPNIAGSAEAGDQFGYSLLLDPTTTSPNGFILALVGVPGEDIGSVKDAGQVQRFWVHPIYVPDELPVLTQGSTGLLRDRVEAGDRVGAALGLRLMDPGSAPAGSLSPVVGVPGESGVHNAGAGIVEYTDDQEGGSAWHLAGYSGGAVTGLHYGAVLGRLA